MGVHLTECASHGRISHGRAPHWRVLYGRVPRRRVPRRRVPHRRASHGRESHCVYLTGMYVMGMHLIGMHLIGVYIMGGGEITVWKRIEFSCVQYKLCEHLAICHWHFLSLSLGEVFFSFPMWLPTSQLIVHRYSDLV